jgi:hypothetical protein
MKNITEEDLILLFYGEHDDPKLAQYVAGSENLSARFEQLSAELSLVENFVPPERDENYGSDVWQQISTKLEPTANKKRGILAWFRNGFLGQLSTPSVSLAGATSIAVVATLAFIIGRQGGQQPVNTIPNPQSGELITQAATAAEVYAYASIDSERLLTRSVAGHLEQVNLMLTQFANTNVSTAKETEYATDMLVANRLYRQAASNQGDTQLAAFLASLEPLMIEMAYEAQKGSPETRERMQQEVKNGLLFRVRVMNNQLSKSEVSL